MSINRVAVIGAGVMGRGVAESLTTTGHQVLLVDVSDEKLEAARHTIGRSVRLHGMFQPATSTQRGELERLEFSTRLSEVTSADFVIENVTEDWEIKQAVWEELDRHCSSGTVLAANTSAIPITRIAGLTGRPEQVLGLHFMNPVPLMPMVEVIRGYHTSEETLQSAKSLLAAMAKECVVVNDSPGFVTNRVMMQMVNEAVFLVHENVASVEEVDRLFKGCFGHKMGPFETADLIGLDTVLRSIEVIEERMSDSKYRPCPLLRKMVDAGLHGRKSGEGFYRYRVESRPEGRGRVHADG